jgi:tetratricopeptide (TPR) repeat protein/TolB-like protein
MSGPDTPSQATTAVFSAGDVLRGRFRILRFLARGGVGEVYEAEDLTLGTTVAVKTLRPELASSEEVLARFRREILLALQVTHPNVCRVFDVFGPAAGESETALTFVTMEMLHGESLAERIRSGGPFSTAAALPLLAQMAAGLDAAHRVGIVHRDFKSANVMLVGGEGPGVRAVVTDFGLARSFRSSERDGGSLTGSHGIVGTTAYMAPEQVEGGPVGQAADIYAFGIVMYEMVTGRRPFSGESQLAIAVKRLREAAPSPRLLAPHLDARWEATILRCLERDAGRRPRSASAAVEALGSVPAPARPGLRRHGRAIAAAAAVCAFLALAAAVLPGARLRRASPAAAATPKAPLPARRAVAVLGFRNLSGRPEAAWLSTAFAETLATELATGEKLRTVAGEEVARLKMELSLGDVDRLAPDTLRRVREKLGADVVVLGSYLHLGEGAEGRLRLDVHIQNAVTGETIASLVESSREDRVFDLVSRTGAQLRERLGVADDVAPAAGTMASTPEALRLYSEGLARLRLLDALGARKFLEDAVATDAGYFPARIALAEAWGMLGYQRKALEEARRAFEHAALAPRELRLSVEGRYREAGQEWDSAVRTYQLLHRLYPDKLDYGLRLAASYTAGGHGKEALDILTDLRGLGPEAEMDPRIDVEEAEAARSLSDFRRMLAAARRAGAEGEQLQARFVTARAAVLEGRALFHLGERDAALRRLEEGRREYDQLGDLDSRAWATMYVGMVRWRDGDPALAEPIYREALAGFRRVGDQRGAAGALNTIAIVVRRRGRVEEATRLVEQSLEAFREIDDRSSVARMLNNRAVIYQDAGDLVQAENLFVESHDMAEAAGSRRDAALALTNIATILRERGDLSGARQRYEQALQTNREIGLKSNAASTCYQLAEIQRAMGRLVEARRDHQACLALREELKEELAAAESLLALATLSLDEGRPAEAEGLARDIAGKFAAQESLEDEARARGILASALYAQGRSDEGRSSIALAVQVARRSRVRAVRLSLSILEARLGAGPGAKELEVAWKRLESCRKEARAGGWFALELDARLAMGEVAMRQGRADAAGILESLEKDAASRSFGLVARKAHEARTLGAPQAPAGSARRASG